MIDNTTSVHVEVLKWFEGKERRDLNIGCGPHYAPGFLNLDVHRGDGNEPDVVVKPNATLPVPAGYLDRVYCGHVLEHVPWPELGEFLGDIRRALKPGGELMVVGPDTVRTLNEWKANTEPWFMVEAVMENDDAYMAGGESWPGARHSWNCYEARVVKALEVAGFIDVEPRSIQNEQVGDLRDWPIVAYSRWQFAVRAVNP